MTTLTARSATEHVATWQTPWPLSRHREVMSAYWTDHTLTGPQGVATQGLTLVGDMYMQF